MKKIPLKKIDAIFFDFDGVLTDDRVFVDQNGKETVACNRKDGLAFETLLASRLKVFIVSREQNPVVAARAAKLKVPVAQGTTNKVKVCEDLAAREGFTLKRALFVGNDWNDFQVMQACGFAACPSDARAEVRKISDVVLKAKGGTGVVSELVYGVLGMKFGA